MSTTLVDAHVHYHACYHPERFLSGAVEHFAAGARALGLPACAGGALLFTESAWDHAFRRFRDEASSLGLQDWKLEPGDEPAAVRATNSEGALLWLIAGRQVVTEEGLEVLALGTDREFADGRPLDVALAAVRASGALTGIPWGFGKWWFGRGRRVAEVLLEPGELFLGDNGGRPQLAQEHPLFSKARARGLAILPGSDPLPFRDQSETAGSYGFRLDAALDPVRPVSSLLAAIRRQSPAFQTFGRREGLLSFARQQVAMQLRPRVRADREGVSA